MARPFTAWLSLGPALLFLAAPAHALPTKGEEPLCPLPHPTLSHKERGFSVSAAPGASFESLAHAAGLNRHDLNALAAAGALASISGNRRQAMWDVTGIESRPPVLQDAPIQDSAAQFAAPTEGQDIVADYASLLGMTPDRLHALCSRELKRSPSALIQQRIVKEAAARLEASSATVKQIAFALGFKDTAYFSRFFSKHTGEAPGAWRHRVAVRSRAGRSRPALNFADWP